VLYILEDSDLLFGENVDWHSQVAIVFYGSEKEELKSLVRQSNSQHNLIYISALLELLYPSDPPATRTSPFFNGIAICIERGSFIALVTFHVPVIGL
jgi:hypothetical protein